MDKIRTQLKEALKDHENTPTDLLIEDIIKRLTLYFKEPPVQIVELDAIKEWVEGRLGKETK